MPEGFETLKRCKPIVAVGAEEPLGGQVLMADYYREWFSVVRRGVCRMVSA